jgi:hypothetical protein
MTMIDRIIGVFKLNSAIFEEIEHDPGATKEAAIVVAIVATVSAMSTGIYGAVAGQSFVNNFLSTIIGIAVAWFAVSAIVYFVGTRVFGGEATYGEMLRVVGYAYAPQILGIIPRFGLIIGVIWTILAMIVALRQGLDISTGKAILTGLISTATYIAVFLILALLFGSVFLNF